MENKIINYKGYVISTEEGTERGIFFRNPIQKIDFMDYTESESRSPWVYMNAIKNPFRRIYEILLGNGEIVKNIKRWSNQCNFAGFSANILCFPVYFKREYRKLSAICNGSDNIQEINAYGYESEYNECGGSCDKEKALFKLKVGKTIKLKSIGTYHFTYPHIIKEIIDTGFSENDTE